LGFVLGAKPASKMADTLLPLAISSALAGGKWLMIANGADVLAAAGRNGKITTSAQVASSASRRKLPGMLKTITTISYVT
jgi:hypothetical protein